MPREAKAQFGMIGMAVMGRNLALNILDHDYSVAGYNLDRRPSPPTPIWAAISYGPRRVPGNSGMARR